MLGPLAASVPFLYGFFAICVLAIPAGGDGGLGCNAAPHPNPPSNEHSMHYTTLTQQMLFPPKVTYFYFRKAESSSLWNVQAVNAALKKPTVTPLQTPGFEPATFPSQAQLHEPMSHIPYPPL